MVFDDGIINWNVAWLNQASFSQVEKKYTGTYILGADFSI